MNAFSSSETKTESDMASTSISTSTSTGAPATATVPAVTTAAPMVTAISLEAALARALEGAMPRLAESIVAAVRQPTGENVSSGRVSETSGTAPSSAGEGETAVSGIYDGMIYKD